MALDNNQRLILTCSRCNFEYPMEEHLFGTPLGEGIVQYGITCPGCGLYSHSYFETPITRQQRIKLVEAEQLYKEAVGPRKILRWEQYKTAQEVYKRHFRNEQKRWRGKKGVKVNAN